MGFGFLGLGMVISVGAKPRTVRYILAIALIVAAVVAFILAALNQ